MALTLTCSHAHGHGCSACSHGLWRAGGHHIPLCTLRHGLSSMRRAVHLLRAASCRDIRCNTCAYFTQSTPVANTPVSGRSPTPCCRSTRAVGAPVAMSSIAIRRRPRVGGTPVDIVVPSYVRHGRRKGIVVRAQQYHRVQRCSECMCQRHARMHCFDCERPYCIHHLTRMRIPFLAGAQAVLDGASHVGGTAAEQKGIAVAEATVRRRDSCSQTPSPAQRAGRRCSSPSIITRSSLW